MSRELLKQCAAALDPFDNKVLLKAIETYLAQPEPEPVFLSELEISQISDGHTFMYGETSPDDVRNAVRDTEQAVLKANGLIKGDYAIPLYTTPSDQSARIADLTERLAKATLDYAKSSNLLTERITELEKQLAAALDPFDNKVLLKAIETELAKPDEPVAWVGIGLMPVSSEDMVRMKTYEPGTANLYDTPLYTTPPDQSARIAELTKQMTEIASECAVLMVKKRDLEKQLAALQAKREPLSDSRIVEIMGNRFPVDAIAFYEGFRAAEEAHGITQ